MKSIFVQCVVLAFVGWVAGCGGTSGPGGAETGPAGQPDGSPADAAWLDEGGSQDDGGSASDGKLPAGLCGTSAFSAKLAGGGPGIPGAQVLTEAGSILVEIEADCSFRTLDGTSDGLGEGRNGTLNEALIQDVEELLAWSRWGELAADYGRDRCDGPDELYVLGERTVQIRSFCPASMLPAPPEFLRPTLISELLDLLVPEGNAATGPVRYILVAPSDSANDLYYQRAPAWPLAQQPSSSATTEEAAYEQDTPVTQASGEDAEALRALRRAFSEGDIGFRDAGFIPIEQPDGTRYQLFVRDVVE